MEKLLLLSTYRGKQEELILLLQMKVISSAMHGAASFKSLGPKLSVPVALLVSTFNKYFKTLSFSTLGIENSVFSEILLLQKSSSLSWFEG